MLDDKGSLKMIPQSSHSILSSAMYYNSYILIV